MNLWNQVDEITIGCDAEVRAHIATCDFIDAQLTVGHILQQVHVIALTTGILWK